MFGICSVGLDMDFTEFLDQLPTLLFLVAGYAHFYARGRELRTSTRRIEVMLAQHTHDDEGRVRVPVTNGAGAAADG